MWANRLVVDARARCCAVCANALGALAQLGAARFGAAGKENRTKKDVRLQGFCRYQERLGIQCYLKAEGTETVSREPVNDSSLTEAEAVAVAREQEHLAHDKVALWRQADVREAMQCGEQDHRVSQPSRRWRCFWPAARISPKIKAVAGESGAASLPWTFGQSHTACTTACTTQLPIACRPAERCTEIAQRNGSVTGFQGEDRECVQQLLEVEALLTPLELKGLQCPSCRRHLQEATGDATKGNTNPAFRARAN